MRKMKKHNESNVGEATALVRLAHEAENPFVRDLNDNSFNRLAYAKVILDPDKLFAKKAIVDVVSSSSFDANIVLAKLEQSFTPQEIQGFAGNDLLVVEFDGILDQRFLTDHLASALEKEVCDNPVKLYKLARQEWFERLDGLGRLQSRDSMGHTSGIVSPNKKQDSEKRKPSTGISPSETIDELSLSHARAPTIDPSSGGLYSSAIDLASDTGVEAIRSIRFARSTYVEAIQYELRTQVGIEGAELISFVKQISTLLNVSGLVVCPVAVTDRYFKLDLEHGSAWLQNVHGGRRVRLKSLPELTVRCVEELNDQRILNSLACANIDLEPSDQVSMKSFSDFIEYIDMVHQHVGKTQLIRQFQRWLDDFPQELRDFGGDLEAKREFARKINERAKILGCRFQCPKEGCGEPAGLSVVVKESSVSGLFVFKHQSDGNTESHGRKTTLPNLRLVRRD